MTETTTCTKCPNVVSVNLADEKGRCFDCQELKPGKIIMQPDDMVSPKDPGQHYRYEYKGIKLDPFRIAKVYGITDFGQQTILKKALRMGSAHKDRRQDLKDIICAAERMLEMISEDETHGEV